MQPLNDDFGTFERKDMSNENGTVEPVHEGFVRHRQQDTPTAIRTRLYRVKRVAEDVMYHPETALRDRLKAAQCIIQASQADIRAVQLHDHEQRLIDLERMLDALPNPRT